MSIPFMKFSNGEVVVKDVPATAAPNPNAVARFSLSGQTAIVTGGAGGLGYSASTALLEHGVRSLFLFDLNASQGATAVTALSSLFPNAHIGFTVLNVTDEVAVEQAVADVVARTGGIDILLCYAGIVNCVPSTETSLAKWRQVLDINTTGTFICAQAVARHMIATHRPGAIVLIASISAHFVNFPQPQAAYNISKAAVVHLAHCLAAEWAVHGIRVNSISPGYMDTVLNEGPALDEAKGIWYSRTPMGRTGAVNELDGAVVLLCSPAGSFITGTDLLVDGGITLI